MAGGKRFTGTPAAAESAPLPAHTDFETHTVTSSDVAAQGKPGAVEKKDAELAASKAAPKAASVAGFTLCKVVGTTVYADGKNHVDGDVAQFSNADIASAPEHLIPVD